MTSISNAVAETADVRDIMALEPSSRENAATPTGADAPVAPSPTRIQSVREHDAPAMAPPRPVHVSSEPAMGSASFDSPAASPGGAAPGSPPQMPPVSPPQMPPVQDYGY